MPFNLKEIKLMEVINKAINTGKKEIEVLEEILKDKNIRPEAMKEAERLCKLCGVDIKEIKKKLKK